MCVHIFLNIKTFAEKKNMFCLMIFYRCIKVLHMNVSFIFFINFSRVYTRSKKNGRRELLLCCQEPAQEIPPMTRSCGRELLSKASGLKGLPRPARASTPKPESVCLSVLRLSPTLLTYRGLSPTTFLWRKSI